MRVWEGVSHENADHKLGVERSLVGISSVRDEAAGVDIGISCTVSMSDFWYLAPLYSPTTACSCVDREGDG